jgi:nucleoside-diphosphate-sugar epimerase
MRVLITGGTGFIGLALGRVLAGKGADVTLADVRPREELVDYPARVLTADVGSWAEVMHAAAAARPELIVHGGAMLSAQGEEAPLRAFQTNGAGTLNVLEAAVLFGARQVLLLSSIATYGAGAPATVDERAPQRPGTMYGITKLLGELLGEYYQRRNGLDARAVRYPSVIGQGRGAGGASAYSTLMIEEPAAGRPYAVPVPPDASLPLLYVDDAVRSLLELAEAPASALRYRAYGIDGFDATADDIAAEVRGRVPDARLTFAPDPATTEIVRGWPRSVSGEAARADWGWTPRFGLQATVEDFVAKVKGDDRARPGP